MFPVKLQPNIPVNLNGLFYMIILFTSSEYECSQGIFPPRRTDSFPSRVLDLIQQGLPLPVGVNVEE